MTTAAAAPVRCAKCGADAVGRFCAGCGSALGARRDLSVRHFLREAAAAITDIDSALLSSFRMLLTKPGELTASYLAGERHRYLPPFRVFLLCNLLYFVVAAKADLGVLSVPLATQLDDMGYRSITRATVTRRLHLDQIAVTPVERAARDSVKRTFETKYNGATEGVAKAIVVVMIPLYALLFQALFAGSRRYFAEHLVFATHIVAFLLVLIPISLYGLTALAFLLRHAVGYHFPPGEAPYDVLLFLVFGWYVFVAQRRAYQSGRPAALGRTVALVLAVLPILVIFKLVLFFATLYWIS